MDQDLIEFLRKRIEHEHIVVTRFTAPSSLKPLTFPCCPKCTNSFSVGTLMDDDCYLENVSMWLRYKKCANCGWRIEIGKYRRFYKPANRNRRSGGSKETSSGSHTGKTNTLDRYNWGTVLDGNATVPS
jgi:hypothetical protein